MADYDLATTLDCGQAFRWRQTATGWEGVIDHRWVSLQQNRDGITARTAAPPEDWRWLEHYLQTQVDFEGIRAAFPADAHLKNALRAHHGLRLLRQPPWECLASFILSSTKQIVQIRQIIALLCDRFGEPVPTDGTTPWHSFPSARRLAAASEVELRACKMGFRAAYLRAAAQAVASEELKLDELGQLPFAEARLRLMDLPGVGEKIADCTLLFSFGYPEAFPVDVWVARALRHYYFRGRNIPLPRLRNFAARRWKHCGGYAQQYLFHHIRHSAGKTSRPEGHAA